MEIDVLFPSFHTVDAHGFYVGEYIVGGRKRHVIHIHVMAVQTVKAVFPEAVASAEQFMMAAPERIGKKDGFQRLQLGKGIENLR